MRAFLWIRELNEWFIVSVHTGQSPFTFSFCYLLCSVCCSTPSPHFSLSVCLCSFPDSVSIAVRTKLVLCTSAGILKLHHSNVVRKLRSASPSLLLPQNWTISAKTVVFIALVAAVNAWHVTAGKLFWKWHSFVSRGLKREKDVWVCQCMLPWVLRKNSTENDFCSSVCRR